MTAFAFGGDPAQLTMAEEILRECVGFMDIEKKFEGVWIACFEDLESARTAQ